jgi:adenylosuccinate synthase
MKRECMVVIDLQFGSTGKGLIAGWLAKHEQPDTVVTAWAANAGHTFVDAAGRTFVHTMLANGIVSPSLRRVLMGPGSIIDPVALAAELTQCRDLLVDRKIDVMIHPHAAIILPEHRKQESDFHAIGSTKKGVGAAAIQRIKREPYKLNVAKDAIGDELKPLVCTTDQYRVALEQSNRVLVEGAQGFSLSMYHGFYPYTTSRDVSTAQVLADCGIPTHWATEVYGTLRTFPIRVANRFDAEGNQIGWSGPWYPDQVEMEWKELGRVAELTTVTKLPRRIASFSHRQIYDAVWQLGVTQLFLNFVNYLPNRAAIAHLVSDINKTIGSLRGVNDRTPHVAFLGDGPAEDNVHRVPWHGVNVEWLKVAGIKSTAEGGL